MKNERNEIHGGEKRIMEERDSRRAAEKPGTPARKGATTR